jgi:hypothetical protein
MKVSYAITVCNEFIEIQNLLPFLLENKRKGDEIVILYDQKNGNEEIATYLTKFNKLPNVQFWRGFFEGDFADWKNKLTSYCSGDYIFQIDADETPSTYLLSILPTVLESNQETEVYLVPRVNTVEGITQEHIQKWNWSIDSNNWINYPDYQWRIYKNNDNIKWVNKVHERLEGFKTYATLPAEEDWSLYHPKTIQKQILQNTLYSSYV